MTTKKTTKTTTKKTRYTTITQRAEIYLASKIRNEIQTTIDIYQMIESYAKSGDKDLRKTILILIEEHKSNYDKLLSITLGNFMKSPLGKDLRRNVAYMNIVNELNRIVNLSDSVVNFIYKTNNLELKDKTWIFKSSKNIVKMLSAIHVEIKKETASGSSKIIVMNKPITLLYRNIIADLNKYTKSSKPKTQEQRNKTRAGVTRAIMTFDSVGKSAARIGESLHFVATGKYKA